MSFNEPNLSYFIRILIYIDYVRPICLPSGKFYRKNLVGRMTEVTGWGIYDMSEFYLTKESLRI